MKLIPALRYIFFPLAKAKLTVKRMSLQSGLKGFVFIFYADSAFNDKKHTDYSPQKRGEYYLFSPQIPNKNLRVNDRGLAEVPFLTHFGQKRTTPEGMARLSGKRPILKSFTFDFYYNFEIFTALINL